MFFDQLNSAKFFFNPRPIVEELLSVRVEGVLTGLDQWVEVAGLLAGVFQHRLGGGQLLALAGDTYLLGDGLVIAANGVGDFSQIASPLGRNNVVTEA